MVQIYDDDTDSLGSLLSLCSSNKTILSVGLLTQAMSWHFSNISCFWQDFWVIPGENVEPVEGTDRKEELEVKQKLSRKPGDVSCRAWIYNY